MKLSACKGGDIVTIKCMGTTKWRLMIQQRDGWFCRWLEGGDWSGSHRFFYNEEECEMVEAQHTKGSNDKGRDVDPLAGMRGEFRLEG